MRENLTSDAALVGVQVYDVRRNKRGQEGGQSIPSPTQPRGASCVGPPRIQPAISRSPRGKTGPKYAQRAYTKVGTWLWVRVNVRVRD